MWKLNFWRLVISIQYTLFIPIYNIKISEEIYEMCPYSYICNRTAQRTLDVDGIVPCCFSCGCDEDCGLRLDCCFDHLDKYEHIEKGNVACVDARKTNGNDKLEIYESNGYYMIQVCDQDTADTTEQRELANDCRLFDEFGNSLVAPVSSIENNSIYINEKCAACNKLNITGLKKWNYLYLHEIKHLEITVTFDIEQLVENKLGVIAYVPPRDENWASKRCFNKQLGIEICNKSDVWYDMCDQFHAPFQLQSKSAKSVYKNVFCALCDGRQINSINKECKKLDAHRSIFKTFTTLLNSAVIDASKLSDIVTVTHMEKSENVCPTGYIEHMKEMCLQIYCPEGMLKIADSCSYFALRWYVPLIAMHLKLVPKQGTRLLISRLQSLGEIERNNPFTWLKSPCRRIKSTSIEVYFSAACPDSGWPKSGNCTSNYVTAFILRLWKTVDTKGGLNPSLIIPMFFKCVRDNWKVTFKKETHTFGAHLDKYTWVDEYGKLKLRKWPDHLRTHDDIERPMLYMFLAEGPINMKLFSLKRFIILKKPFFCKQVRIPQYDVEIHFGEIRIISRNISVGTNEYLVNSPLLKGNTDQRDWNKTTFSICIEDYDPSYTENPQTTIHAKASTLIFIMGIVSFCLRLMHV